MNSNQILTLKHQEWLKFCATPNSCFYSVQTCQQGLEPSANQHRLQSASITHTMYMRSTDSGPFFAANYTCIYFGLSLHVLYMFYQTFLFTKTSTYTHTHKLFVNVWFHHDHGCVSLMLVFLCFISFFVCVSVAIGWSMSQTFFLMWKIWLLLPMCNRCGEKLHGGSCTECSRSPLVWSISQYYHTRYPSKGRAWLFQEVCFLGRACARQNCIAMRKTVEPFNNGKVPLCKLVAGHSPMFVVCRAEQRCRVVQLHATLLILQRLAVHQRKKEVRLTLDRIAELMKSALDSLLRNLQCLGVAGKRLRRPPVHIAGKLIENNHKSQAAGVILLPVVQLPSQGFFVQLSVVPQHSCVQFCVLDKMLGGGQILVPEIQNALCVGG